MLISLDNIYKSSSYPSLRRPGKFKYVTQMKIHNFNLKLTYINVCLSIVQGFS